MSDPSSPLCCLLMMSNDIPLHHLLEWYLQERTIPSIVVSAVGECGVYITERRKLFVVINDQLPYTDALGIAAELRAQTDMPILVLLDTVRPNRTQQAYTLKANYLVKPFDSDEINGHLQAIQNLFR